MTGGRSPLVLALIALALLTIGCGAGRPQGTPFPTLTYKYVTPTGGTGARPTITIIPVRLTEYRILMPDPVPEGSAILRIENVGKIPHGFRLARGLYSRSSVGLTEELEPGASAELRIFLHSGQYRVYCPLDGHAEKGMKRYLRVFE